MLGEKLLDHALLIACAIFRPGYVTSKEKDSTTPALYILMLKE